MAAKLSYADWLKKSGRRSSDVNARAWANWAGQPAPRGRGAPGRPPARRRGPGVATPPYMGYAGAIDPSFGGTPLSTPADAGLVWTGAGNPDLAEIARGGYGQLTPKKRPGGGWDVYGTPLDPTPQWGKDYLEQLRSREQRHTAYVDQQVSPWLANVLGSAQTVNNQAQIGLANQMAQVNTQAANAVPGGAAPVGMTGAGSGAGVGSDLAGAANAQTQAGARIGSGAYSAALSNLTMGTSADAQAAALAQSRLRLPGQYEQMRMDFSEKLGQITESIKENQRAREFQRQQLLESRRQFGLTFAEQRRAARAGEEIQRGALELEERGQDWEMDPNNPDNVPAMENTQQRSLEQIRQDLNQGERVIDGPNGSGFASEAAGRRATRSNPNVSWEVAEDGKWYGVYTPRGVESSSNDGSSSGSGDYAKRLREYPFEQYVEGRYKDPTAGQQGRQLVEGAKTWQWIVEDLAGRQKFKPTDQWQMVWPRLKQMQGTLFNAQGGFVRGRKYDVAKLFVQRWFRDMPGNANQKASKIAKIVNWPEDRVKFMITNGRRWTA